MWKKGQALVPTWTAFAVVGLLEQHFDELVDYAFTAQSRERPRRHRRRRHARRTSGCTASTSATTHDSPGLKRLVEENLDEIDAAAINTFPIGIDADGKEIVVKPGKYGPYVKRGDDTASVPEDLAARRAHRRQWRSSCWPCPKSDEPIGELDGLPVFAKNGRYGPYVQWGTPTTCRPGSTSRRWRACSRRWSLDRITVDDAEALLQLPRTLGVDPADGEPIVANNGRYGPYVQKGKDFRTLDNEEQLLTITLDEAPAIFSPSPRCTAAARPNMAAKGPLREFGNDPVSERAGRRQGRPVRRVRDRRRDQRVDRQGRPDRGDAARAGLRAAGDPPRAGGGEGRPGEEGRRPRGPPRRQRPKKTDAARRRPPTTRGRPAECDDRRSRRGASRRRENHSAGDAPR